MTEKEWRILDTFRHGVNGFVNDAPSGEIVLEQGEVVGVMQFGTLVPWDQDAYERWKGLSQ